MCGLSVLRLRISTALNIFMGSFVILFLLFCMFLQGRVQSGIMLIITLILAMGLAVLGYLQHSYGFMIVTAVLGGFIAMIGVSSISADSNPGYIILTLMTEASETEKSCFWQEACCWQFVGSWFRCSQTPGEIRRRKRSRYIH